MYCRYIFKKKSKYYVRLERSERLQSAPGQKTLFTRQRRIARDTAPTLTPTVANDPRNVAGLSRKQRRAAIRVSRML